MEQRRFFLFLALSMAILMGWMNIGPILLPGLFPKPKPRKPAQARQVEAPKDEKEKPQVDVSAPSDEGQSGEMVSQDQEPATSDGDANEAAPAELDEKALAIALPDHPAETVVLGSKDPESGYFLEVSLTNVGASVVEIELNDERYKTLDQPDKQKPRPQLKVVGNHIDSRKPIQAKQPDFPLLTFQTAFPELDKAFHALDPDADARRLCWDVVKVESDDKNPQIHTSATFRLRSPDDGIEVQKKYWLTRVQAKPEMLRLVRDTDPSGYELHCELSLHNRGQDPRQLQYVLQGPVGLPLENADNTRKFLDIKVGFRESNGTVDYKIIRARDVADKPEAEIEELNPAPRAFQFVGVDVQYFAALLFPSADQLATPEGSYIDFAKPVVVKKQAQKDHSDISVCLNSHKLDLAPDQEILHTYTLFAGPKRNDLLLPHSADAILDFSTWFGIGYVSKGMVWLLNNLHKIGIPYGIAIILMTVFVRGAMYPISRKQALGAKKMKELQPQLTELKKKYAKEKDKLAKAQMELFAKHQYNPLSGCLPLFLQLPIFIGLYQSLNSSVDLRLAPFLWMDNLAAPDAMFPFGFRMPLVGWTDFNLLPILTVILFLVQQKMFMPPPTDEQSAMQQKMMNYMMIFFGFMFYRLPSGLCVYFIASSLWGMGERKLLDYAKEKDPKNVPDPPGGDKASGNEKKHTGFWARLADQIDAAAQLKKLDQQPSIQTSSSSRKKSKKPRPKR